MEVEVLSLVLVEVEAVVAVAVAVDVDVDVVAVVAVAVAVVAVVDFVVFIMVATAVAVNALFNILHRPALRRVSLLILVCFFLPPFLVVGLVWVGSRIMKMLVVQSVVYMLVLTVVFLIPLCNILLRPVLTRVSMLIPVCFLLPPFAIVVVTLGSRIIKVLWQGLRPWARSPAVHRR
jgi:hypothetical protein